MQLDLVSLHHYTFMCIHTQVAVGSATGVPALPSAVIQRSGSVPIFAMQSGSQGMANCGKGYLIWAHKAWASGPPTSWKL